MYSYVYNIYIYILNKNSNSQVKIEQGNIQYKIKGPDNPTSQLLPIRSNKCCSGTGKEGKTKEVVKDREVKTVVWDKVVCERWCVAKKDGVCVTKLCVKDGVCVCAKVVCERESVTKLCVKDGVWQSGEWKMVSRKMVCDKVVCERWCGERWCVTKWYVKDGVWKMVCDGVWKMVCQRWCVTKWWVKDGVAKNGVWQSCVWKMVWWKMVCDCVWMCVTKWCVKDGVSKMVCDEVPHCQPNATSAMPATQMEVNVAKCHTCHAKWRSTTKNKNPTQRCGENSDERLFYLFGGYYKK